jgi:hypothetical protein
MNKRQQAKNEKLFESGIDKIKDRLQPSPQEREAILKTIRSSPSHKERLLDVIMTGLKLQAKEAANFEPKRKNKKTEAV